ncbi:MAG TPA: hypothetical protein PK078_07840 [Anaerolineales bacterium]|nr:hypothetical protein [Anaerolineales bacterium]HNA89080.1 hypothetical protein [Anaerolineales bacterium]HNB36740.1 hypothetical protein [Anaerolineales bacterium]HNC08108.1 hypothetical protein [Anaerolineales bacterium]
MTLVFSILRILHIVTGILWAGGALALTLFVAPTMSATGEAGKQFAGHLITKTRFSLYMMVTGLSTVLAGSVLYGIDSNWFQSAWMMTGMGIGFGIGAVAGIAAFIFGIMLGNANSALAALGAQIQGKPTAEQMTALQGLLKRQALTSQMNMIFMFIAIVMMALARLLG